jgi:hypothetical protein
VLLVGLFGPNLFLFVIFHHLSKKKKEKKKKKKCCLEKKNSEISFFWLVGCRNKIWKLHREAQCAPSARSKDSTRTCQRSNLAPKGRV